MKTLRRIVAVALMVAALAVTLLMTPAAAGGKCSPGQHGNPKPAFKPGVCR